MKPLGKMPEGIDLSALGLGETARPDTAGTDLSTTVSGKIGGQTSNNVDLTALEPYLGSLSLPREEPKEKQIPEPLEEGDESLRATLKRTASQTLQAVPSIFRGAAVAAKSLVDPVIARLSETRGKSFFESLQRGLTEFEKIAEEKQRGAAELINAPPPSPKPITWKSLKEAPAETVRRALNRVIENAPVSLGMLGIMSVSPVAGFGLTAALESGSTAENIDALEKEGVKVSPEYKKTASTVAGLAKAVPEFFSDKLLLDILSRRTGFLTKLISVGLEAAVEGQTEKMQELIDIAAEQGATLRPEEVKNFGEYIGKGLNMANVNPAAAASWLGVNIPKRLLGKTPAEQTLNLLRAEEAEIVGSLSGGIFASPGLLRTKQQTRPTEQKKAEPTEQEKAKPAEQEKTEPAEQEKAESAEQKKAEPTEQQQEIRALPSPKRPVDLSGIGLPSAEPKGLLQEGTASRPAEPREFIAGPVESEIVVALRTMPDLTPDDVENAILNRMAELEDKSEEEKARDRTLQELDDLLEEVYSGKVSPPKTVVRPRMSAEPTIGPRYVTTLVEKVGKRREPEEETTVEEQEEKPEKARPEKERVGRIEPEEIEPQAAGETEETARPTFENLKKAVRLAKEVFSKTGGLKPEEQFRQARDILKARGFHPVIIDEITNPERLRKPDMPEDVSREGRFRRASEPPEEFKPFLSKLTDLASDYQQKKADYEAARDDLVEILRKRGVSIITADDGKTPVDISVVKGRSRLTPAAQRALRAAIQEAAESGGFSASTVSQGLQLLVTPLKEATGRRLSGNTFAEQVRDFLARHQALKDAEKSFRMAKDTAIGRLADDWLARKAAGEKPPTWRGYGKDNKAEIQVRRPPSEAYPDIEPYKSKVKELRSKLLRKESERGPDFLRVSRTSKASTTRIAEGRQERIEVEPVLRQASLFEEFQPNYEVRGGKKEEAYRLAREAVEGLAKGRKKGRIHMLANAISAEAREKGTVRLVGKKVESPDDLAALAQVYRDPRWETLRYVFVKDGKIVDVIAFSSRLPQVNLAFPGLTMEGGIKWLGRLMQKTGADGYYMLHNHPAGSSQPSVDDIRTTEDISKNVSGFLGHVVIDSNEYSVIKPTNEGLKTETISRDFGEEKLLRPSIDNPFVWKRVETTEDIREIAKHLEQKNGWITLIGVNPKGKVSAIGQIEADVFRPAKNKKRAAALLRRFARHTGTSQVFAVTEHAIIDKNLDSIKKAIEYGLISNAIDIETGRLASSEADWFGKVRRKKDVYLGSRIRAYKYRSEAGLSLDDIYNQKDAEHGTVVGEPAITVNDRDLVFRGGLEDTGKTIAREHTVPIPIISPKQLTGKKVFILASDRMKVGAYTGLDKDSGINIMLHGGPLFPFIRDHHGKSGWAVRGKTSATRLLNAIRKSDGIGLIMLQSRSALIGNKSFLRALLEELKYGIRKKDFSIKDVLGAYNQTRKDVLTGMQKDVQAGRLAKIPPLLRYIPKNMQELSKVLEQTTFDLQAEIIQRLARKKTIQEYNLPDINRMIDLFTEDLFRDAEYGDIVGAIDFQPRAGGHAEIGGIPHESYGIHIAGRGIGLFDKFVDVTSLLKDKRPKHASARSAMLSAPVKKVGKSIKPGTRSIFDYLTDEERKELRQAIQNAEEALKTAPARIDLGLLDPHTVGLMVTGGVMIYRALGRALKTSLVRYRTWARQMLVAFGKKIRSLLGPIWNVVVTKRHAPGSTVYINGMPVKVAASANHNAAQAASNTWKGLPNPVRRIRDIVFEIFVDDYADAVEKLDPDLAAKMRKVADKYRILDGRLRNAINLTDLEKRIRDARFDWLEHIASKRPPTAMLEEVVLDNDGNGYSTLLEIVTDSRGRIPKGLSDLERDIVLAMRKAVLLTKTMFSMANAGNAVFLSTVGKIRMPLTAEAKHAIYVAKDISPLYRAIVNGLARANSDIDVRPFKLPAENLLARRLKGVWQVRSFKNRKWQDVTDQAAITRIERNWIKTTLEKRGVGGFDVFPDYVTLDGNLIPVTVTSPFDVLSAFCAENAKALALISEFGADYRRRLAREQELLADKGIGTRPVTEWLEAYFNLRPVPERFIQSRDKVFGPARSFARMLDTTLKTLALTASAPLQIPSVLMVLHKAGYRSFFKGAADTFRAIINRKGLAEMAAAGAVHREVYNFSIKKGEIFEDIARVVRQTVERVTLFKQANKFQSYFAAFAMRAFADRLIASGGKMNRSELATLVSLNFSRDDIDKIRSGKMREGDVLYNAIIGRSVRYLTGEGLTGGENSRFLRSPIAQFLLPFSSWPVLQMRTFSNEYRIAKKLFKVGDYKTLVGRTVRLFGGAVAAGELQFLLGAMLFGTTLRDAWERPDEELYERIFNDLLTGAILGPFSRLAWIVLQSEQTTERIAASITFLGNIAYDMANMLTNSHEFANQTFWEKSERMLRKRLPAMKYGDGFRQALAVMGLGKADDLEYRALRRLRWKWMDENDYGTPEDRRGYRESTVQFRKVYEAALEGKKDLPEILKDALSVKQQEIMEQAEKTGREPGGGIDASAINSLKKSLGFRKFLTIDGNPMSEAQIASLRAFVGDWRFEKMRAHDALIDELIASLGGSGRRRERD